MPTSRELRDRLGGLPRATRTIQVWRAVRPGYDLTSTRGARLHGGRWNPRGLAVLYASLEAATVRAELIRATERQGIPESAIYPVRLAKLELAAEVVDLRKPGALGSLGIEQSLFLTRLAATRAVGSAASRLRIGALIVPSVTGAGDNTVIFPASLLSSPQIIEAVDLRRAKDWPAP